MLKPDFDRYSLALFHEDRIVFSSAKEGLRPLVECIRACRGRFSGCELHDRAVGLAAAKLVVATGGMINRIVARRASERAMALLKRHSVPIVAGEVVPILLNRDRSGPCLMERKASATEDPHQFLREIDAFFS